MVKNAYIHIPFCKSKCHYCSFVSYSKLELKSDYLNALENQIRAEYKDEALNTLYLGGGTPSLLQIDEIKSLLDLFKFEDKSEITIEVNPDSVDYGYFCGLKDIGINRISIGSQTFEDKILKLIGRRHNQEQIKQAVLDAQKAGFDNISLDFIYGLPTQALKSFISDLRIAIDLPIQHISLYGLKIDKDCYFDNYKPDNLPDIDLQADMYLKAVEVLKESGFEHYEISNFARNKAESKHNLNYWNNNSYYGFGCAASGYLSNIRYTNELKLEDYIINPLILDTEEELSQQEILEEEIFLGLRKSAGINIEEINSKFNIDFERRYTKILDKYQQFFAKNDKKLALNVKGMMISTEILSEFIDL